MGVPATAQCPRRAVRPAGQWPGPAGAFRLVARSRDTDAHGRGIQTFAQVALPRPRGSVGPTHEALVWIDQAPGARVVRRASGSGYDSRLRGAPAQGATGAQQWAQAVEVALPEGAIVLTVHRRLGHVPGAAYEAARGQPPGMGRRLVGRAQARRQDAATWRTARVVRGGRLLDAQVLGSRCEYGGRWVTVVELPGGETWVELQDGTDRRPARRAS